MEISDDEFYFDEETEKFYTFKGGKSYEDFFKELGPIKYDYSFQKVNNVNVTFSKNSKYIKFTKDGKSKNIFVVNSYQVNFLLNKFNYKDYKVDGKNMEEINIDDNLDFSEIIFLENLLTKDDYNKAKENIKEKMPILLDDLSLIYYDYQKYKEKSEFILTKERTDFFERLKVLNKKKKFIPICGPKSIGKTTSLLYYLKMNAMCKYFYINLSYCKNLLVSGNKKKLCLCICKELFNCLKFNDVNNFYNSLYEKNFQNIMEIVLLILKYIIEKDPFSKTYILLDQFKEKIDKDYNIIKEIEILTKINSKFNVIVCSSINEFDFRNSLSKKLNNSDQFYLNYLFVNKLISVDINKIKNELNDEEKELLKASGNLFLYFHHINENKIIKEKKPVETKREIMNHIINEINDYFKGNDNNKKLGIIETIHDNIDKRIKFIDLKEKLSYFPFKFFNLFKDDQNMFNIEDLNKDTELIINPSYPIVIDCINEIFHNSKYELKDNSSNETKKSGEKSKKSTELEENFNRFLWFYKNNFSFYGCKIVKKITITSLLDMKTSEGNTISKAVKDLENISDSILIIQTSQNAKHYDTAILKLCKIENDEKIFELYLFQETLKKEAKERLLNSTLIEDKTCLKYKFFLNSKIILENIYFSYVFENDNLDKVTMDYCKDTNINYQIYDDKSIILIDSKIDTKITPKFEYPSPSKENIDEKKYLYSLNILDIDYTHNDEKLNEEYTKLQSYLNKKRNLKKKEPEDLSSKINIMKEYVNNEFRNYEIADKLAGEHLMKEENKEIVGVSFLVDEQTKDIKTSLNFQEVELNNLKNHMKNYNDNLEILKIIKLPNGHRSILLPNYDCCILQVDSKKEKSFIDVKANYAYSLKNNKKTKKIELDGDFYLIKFTVKNMIYNK